MRFLSFAAMGEAARIFGIRGGVHPETRKHLTARCAIEPMQIPALLRVPLHQHAGAPAEPVVARDDLVRKGQLIGKARGAMSANVHAPTSGRVISVGFFAAPHPSGLPVPTVTIRPDGEDRWGPRLARLRPESADPEAIAARVHEAGIVGMGGASFPSAVKLNLRGKYDLHTLLINAAECEPYLTCDDRLMQEQAEEVADGAGIIAKAIGATRIVIAIEGNKPEAISAMRRYPTSFGRKISVVVVPTQYPVGSAKHLVQMITGKETPARALIAELGILVHNVATAHAVHLAVRYGEPLISRVVTVSGGAVARPANVQALVGAPVADILEHCGGLVGEPDRLLLGGPMMGQPIQNARVPVVKGTNGVLALSKGEVRSNPVMPCIRCGSCVQVCPCGLTPYAMNAMIQVDDLEGAAKVGLLDCMSCGSCSYVCPSGISLVQAFDFAKGSLAEKQSRKHQQEEARRLAAARAAREAAIEAAKREAFARRKAELAASRQRGAGAAAPGTASAGAPPVASAESDGSAS